MKWRSVKPKPWEVRRRWSVLGPGHEKGSSSAPGDAVADASLWSRPSFCLAWEEDKQTAIWAFIFRTKKKNVDRDKTRKNRKEQKKNRKNANTKCSILELSVTYFCQDTTEVQHKSAEMPFSFMLSQPCSVLGFRGRSQPFNSTPLFHRVCLFWN